MPNVVLHQGREAIVQTQHQADPLICARGNGTGFLAWIKERRGFAHGMGKDPFAQSQFLSCVLECPPQYSVLLHLAKALPNRCARLVACLAHLGCGVQRLAGASWQFHQPHHHPTRQPREGRDIHEWSPPFTAGCPWHPDTAPASSTSQGPVVADAESRPCGDWLAMQCRFNWIWQRCQLCIGGKQVLDFVICPVW